MATSGYTRKPQEIEADLDRTRAQMSDTLEALQRKLSPNEMFDQALGYFRASGGSEFSENFKQSIVQNPVPVGLVGVGLAWLMLTGGRGIPMRLRTSDETFRDKAGGVVSTARGRTQAMASGVKGVAGSARAGASHVASSSRERMHQLSHGVSSGASHLSAVSRQSATRAKQGLDYMLHEQPLVLGAVGAVVGAALAATLPHSRREDELMGETRDAFVESARATSKAQAEKARQIAKSARDAALEQANQEGLTAESVTDKLKEGQEKAARVAEAASNAAKDEANRQGNP